MSRTRLLHLTLVMTAALTACLSDARVDGHVLQASLVDRVARGPGTIIDFDSLVPTPWTRMWEFGPYTGSWVVGNCTKAPRPEGLLHGVDATEDNNLLVFQFPDSQYVSLRMPRRVVEFGPGVGRRTIERRDARFVLRPGLSGQLEAVLVDSTRTREDCAIVNRF